MLRGGICDFDRQFLFHSYLLNLSSNFTKMVTFESYKPGLSDLKNDFYRLYNERAKALQSSITFSYTPCIAKIYLFSFVETPRKFMVAELSVRKLASSSVLIINLFIYLFILLCNNKFTWRFHKAEQLYCIHHANVMYLQLLLPRLYIYVSLYTVSAQVNFRGRI